MINYIRFCAYVIIALFATQSKCSQHVNSFVPYCTVQLIVEIKRSSNDPKKDFKTISKQLDKQTTTLFAKGKYEHMYGIIAVGQCWKLYKYNFVKTNTHKRTWSNTSYTNEDYIENYEVVEESGILNISSKDYYNDFNKLMRSLNQIS